MGHRLTNKGVQPDPSKVAVIMGMPTPVDKAAVQRFLGMCQYLSKFCQNLSQTVLLLRDLTRDDIEFLWSDVHDAAFNSAKSLIASTTALHYYVVSLPVIRQVDASDSAIGRVLLQEGHPVCFTSSPQHYRKKLCSDRERVLGNCAMYGEMASLPIWKSGHNSPLRSSAFGDHFQETFEQSSMQVLENDIEIAELSLYCSVQERERAPRGRH